MGDVEPQGFGGERYAINIQAMVSTTLKVSAATRESSTVHQVTEKVRPTCTGGRYEQRQKQRVGRRKSMFIIEDAL